MNAHPEQTHSPGGSVGDLLNTKQAAEFLTIRPRTLADWRAAKLIPVIERPGYVRFLRSDLEAFLQRHRVEARKAPAYRPRRKRSQPATNDPQQATGDTGGDS